MTDHNEFNRIERCKTDGYDSRDGKYLMFEAFVTCYFDDDEFDLNVIKFLYCAYDITNEELYTLKVEPYYGFTVNEKEYIANNGSLIKIVPIEDAKGDDRYTITSEWWYSQKKSERSEMMNRLIVDNII